MGGEGGFKEHDIGYIHVVEGRALHAGATVGTQMGQSGLKSGMYWGRGKALECLWSLDVLCGEGIKPLPVPWRELNAEASTFNGDMGAVPASASRLGPVPTLKDLQGCGAGDERGKEENLAHCRALYESYLLNSLHSPERRLAVSSFYKWGA